MSNIVSKENAPHYLWGEQCDGWHLVSTERLSIIQERVPPHKGEVRHFHQQAEQFFFVLSGVATLEVDGKMHEIHPHQGVHVPANVAHQMINLSDEDVVFIVTSTPPTKGDRILV